jgi:sugar lactone lactonase YvrE
MAELSVLAENLGFTEGPRWHDGKLWFSDFISRKVHTIDRSGNISDIVEVPNVPSGLGWLPDGRLLVVSMEDRKVMRLDEETLVEHADLAHLATFHCNDMVVDAQGRAYVGNFGFDFQGGAPLAPAKLVRVDPDGSCHVAAEDLIFPNGTVITPAGTTLVIGETFAGHLTAFDVAADGSLSGRRIFAELGPEHAGNELTPMAQALSQMYSPDRPLGPVPDGICLDAEGAIWMASPTTNEVIRVGEGTTVLDRVSTGTDGSYACMLGGDDRKTLFVCAASALQQPGTGKLLTIEVDVPGAGLP